MTFGASFLSSGGFTQIDDNFSNYRIIQSGSGTAAPSIGFAIARSITFPTQDKIPLVFVRPPYGSKISSSFDTEFFGAITKSNFYVACAGSSPTYQYAVAAPIQGSSSSATHGMRVYNNSGSIVFDSGFQYPNIDAIHNIVMPSSQLGIFTEVVTLPPPQFGLRYIMLNALKSGAGVTYTVSESDGQLDSYVICATLNSETSVTYSNRIDAQLLAGTQPPFQVFFETIGSTVSLLSAYMDI